MEENEYEFVPTAALKLCKFQLIKFEARCSCQRRASQSLVYQTNSLLPVSSFPLALTGVLVAHKMIEKLALISFVFFYVATATRT